MSISKREALRLTEQENTLINLGFTSLEADKLRRISLTLRRWYELECGSDNGCIERDEETGKTYWRSSYSSRLSPVADRETGAKKRLTRIIQIRNAREFASSGLSNISEVALKPYLQTDPRGATLYILRPNDIPQGKEADSYYSRGICIY